MGKIRPKIRHKNCIVCGSPIVARPRTGERTHYCDPACYDIMLSVRQYAERAMLRLLDSPGALRDCEIRQILALDVPLIERHPAGWQLLPQGRILVENIPANISRRNKIEPRPRKLETAE